MARGLFFHFWTHLVDGAVWDFCSCEVQLKADLRVSLWILCAPDVKVVFILARSNQNYPSVALTSQGGLWSLRV
jgi:hypothetical protein